MEFFNVKHPMFNPLWVRILITGVCTIWAMLEFGSGNPFWGILFAGIAAFCIWKFFVKFEMHTGETDEGDKGAG